MDSMNPDVPQKVKQYETFINEVLREDLRKVLDSRDKIYSQIAEYLQLKNVIERIQESNLDIGQLKTKVDLGCNFYVQASIPDSSMIYVAVGFGFFVEFTLTEAVKFIGKKIDQLTRSSEKLTIDSARIKAHINLVLEGLKEIQNLSGFHKEEKTPVW